MDMMQPGMPQEGGEDPKAMLQQAQELIAKALEAMGGEAPAEESEAMGVEEAFRGGFKGSEVS